MKSWWTVLSRYCQTTGRIRNTTVVISMYFEQRSRKRARPCDGHAAVRDSLAISTYYFGRRHEFPQSSESQTSILHLELNPTTCNAYDRRGAPDTCMVRRQRAKRCYPVESGSIARSTRFEAWASHGGACSGDCAHLHLRCLGCLRPARPRYSARRQPPAATL